MKFYITKYALTNGIVEWDVDEPKPECPKFLQGPTCFEHAWIEGNQWHRTIESAKHKCEEMRVNKIKGLKKQIDKLEKLKF